jgi:hypothetical protein
MDIVKTLSPITKTLKDQKTSINFVLIFVVLLMLFPYTHFLPFDIKNKINTQLKKLTSSPWIMALITVLVYSIYITGDIYMFTLTLFIVHRLTLH